MLVYLKNDMAYTQVSGKRVYGKKYAYGSMGPTEITKSAYENNKDRLTEAEYNARWLKTKYGKEFPDITFKYTELSKVDYGSLVKIAHAIGIKYHRGRGKPNRSQLMALRRSVALKLDSDAK